MIPPDPPLSFSGSLRRIQRANSRMVHVRRPKGPVAQVGIPSCGSPESHVGISSATPTSPTKSCWGYSCVCNVDHCNPWGVLQNGDGQLVSRRFRFHRVAGISRWARLSLGHLFAIDPSFPSDSCTFAPASAPGCDTRRSRRPFSFRPAGSGPSGCPGPRHWSRQAQRFNSGWRGPSG